MIKTIIIAVFIFILFSNVQSQQANQKVLPKTDYIGSSRGTGVIDTIKTGDSLKTIALKTKQADNYLHIHNVTGTGADTFVVSNRTYGKNNTLLDEVQFTGTMTYDGLDYLYLVVPEGQKRAFYLNDRLIDVLVIRRISNSGGNYQINNKDYFFLTGGTLGANGNSNKSRFKSGFNSALPNLMEGQVFYATDEQVLYVGTTNGTRPLYPESPESVTIDMDVPVDTLDVDCSYFCNFKLSYIPGPVIKLENLPNWKWINIKVDNMLLGIGEPTFADVVFPADEVEMEGSTVAIYSFINIDGTIYGATRKNYY